MTQPGLASFQTDAVRFAYPANWVREVEETPEGVSVSLQSEGVTFAIVGVYDSRQEPEELVDQVLDSLRAEHPSIEIDDVSETQEDATYEGTFISLDMVSYCWLRSWRVAGRSLLVFVQSVEPESKMSHQVFEAICASVAPVD